MDNHPKGGIYFSSIHDFILVNCRKKCTTLDVVSNTSTTGPVTYNYEWEYIASFTEPIFWKSMKMSSMTCYKIVEKEPGIKNPGDRFHFRCSRWENSRCTIAIYGERRQSNPLEIACFRSSVHASSCEILKNPDGPSESEERDSIQNIDKDAINLNGISHVCYVMMERNIQGGLLYSYIKTVLC